MKKNLFILLIVAPLFGLILTASRIYYNIGVWTHHAGNQIFEVKSGEAFSSINYRLYKKNIISSKKLFYRYAQINELMTKFKVGHFIIKNNLTMIEVFDALLKGKALTTKVTIPEGKNLYQIADILSSKKITKRNNFIKAAKDKTLMKKLSIPAETAEGYLYPDTYYFAKESKPQIVIKTMVQTFNKTTKNLIFKQRGFSKHEIIILASIVEKETGAAWERPKIAGVFLNRLLKRMRLQSDPTTIYGIWERFNGNLKKRDLLEKTPYNTYKFSGFPKGPISNPGIKAIQAVLYPEKHKFYYFVSKNDGTHIFSEKYRDHVNSVNKFQKQKKYRKGRSWRDLKKHQPPQEY